MFHLDNNSGISAMPKPASQQSLATRWFTEGGGNNSPSWPGQDWYNIVQAELLNTLNAAGIAPDKDKLNQLSLAIKALIGENALLKSNLLSEIKNGGVLSQRSARENLDITDASLNKKGLVALSSATDSDSESQAATPRAVKAANDNANSRVQAERKINGHALSADIQLTANDVGAVPVSGGTMSGELSTTNYDSYRIKAGNRSFFLRFDGNDFYILKTAKGDPNGAWDNSRPLRISAADGRVYLGANTRIEGNLFAQDACLYTDGNINGSKWGGYLSDWLNNKLNAVRSRADDAWNKANDAQVNRVTADWVWANYLPRSHDQNTIGTFVLAWSNTGNVDYGTVVSGGNVFPATADGTHVGWSLPGAWRCAGAMRTTNNAHRVTLWQRVA